MPGRRVMVVDNEPAIAELVASILIEEGHQVSTFLNAAKAFDVIQSGYQAPDLIIVDLWLPEVGGDIFCQQVASLRLDIPCVVMSGATEADEVAAYLGLRLLKKPLLIEDLLAVVADPRLRVEALNP